MSRNIYSTMDSLTTNFLMHPCLHKIIVQPLAVFRRSPSPFNSVWRDGALSSYSRQTRHKDETRGNSRRESAESEESPSLVPTPLWFLGRLSVAPLLLSRRMLRKNQSHDYFFFFWKKSPLLLSIRLARTALVCDSIRPKVVPLILLSICLKPVPPNQLNIEH